MEFGFIGERGVVTGQFADVAGSSCSFKQTPEPPNLAAAAEFCQLAESQLEKNRPGRRWFFRSAAQKNLALQP